MQAPASCWFLDGSRLLMMRKYIFLCRAAYFGDSDTATLLNELVVDGKTYYAVKSTLADGNGNFELADIPPGEYTLVMQSNHAKGGYTYETVQSKKPNKKPKTRERLNQRDSLGRIDSVIVTVEAGKTTDEPFDFGVSIL